MTGSPANPNADSTSRGNAQPMEHPIHPGDDERGTEEQSASDRPAVPDSPGTPGGTAGTGGENKVQDSQFER